MDRHEREADGIRGDDPAIGLRGDTIRIWETRDSVVDGNLIEDGRDVVVWYSNGNTIKKNTSVRSRYSLHFMSSGHNVVEDNRFYENSVGIYVMYTDGIEIRRAARGQERGEQNDEHHSQRR